MAVGHARTALVALGAAGAVGVAAGVWGIGIERYLFTVRHQAVRALPAGSRALRILHVSDAHLAPWQRRKQEWMAALVRFEPDLVINTGDNLGHPDGLRGVRRAFDPLRGIPGLYVHGSNDRDAPSARNPFRYFAGPSRRRQRPEALDTGSLDRYLQDELGWICLDNDAASLSAGGLRITAVGTDDAHHDLDRLDVLPARTAALPVADVTLGVTHAPYRRVLDALTDVGADAIFAGHTHGGQVRLPGYGALVANCDLPLAQARGLSTWTHDGRSTALTVSAGLGHSIYAPVRFACRPEASLVTLLPRD
ncbi:metallophosphoesterase [Microbacterium sp. X-17]|uniref:metallophosphoesterase n=1 Tax=Microbacterium sp. X-17 TaxID=3144404 RepID=UPI0031F49EDB